MFLYRWIGGADGATAEVLWVHGAKFSASHENTWKSAKNMVKKAS